MTATRGRLHGFCQIKLPVGFGSGRLTNLAHDRAGAAAVTLALSLTGIAGLAGIGTEGASWYYTQRAMQGAADAAAHSAATAKSNGAGASALTMAAQSVAAGFNFSSSSNATVTVNSPPASGSHTADGNAIEVIISEPMPRYLSGMFISTGPTITARAVALANVSLTAPACVVALDTHAIAGIDTSGNPQLGFNGCSLFVNAAGSTAATVNGSAQINAKAAYIHGSVNGAGLSTTDGTFTGVDPLRDPYASVPSPSAPTTTGNCGTGGASGNGLDKLFKNTTTVTINPVGCTEYGFGGSKDLHLTNTETLNLCPGTYVFDAASLIMDGQSTLNAPPTGAALTTLCPGNTSGGVTLIFTNSSGGNPGIPNIGAGANVNLTAPNSGTYSGIALFEDRLACAGNGNNNNGCNPSLTGGGTQNITGAIYAPKATMTYSGNNSTGATAPPCTQLVASQITFTGNSQFNNSCSTAGTKTIGTLASQLVE